MTSILHGVVLESRDFKEHDRFYTLYTRERGKVRAMGKGTRKFLSKLAAHLQPFTEVQVMVAHGRLWPKLAGVERGTDFVRIREDLSLFGLGLGLNELMVRAVEDGEPDPQLYQFLLDAYDWIQTLPEPSPRRLAFIHSALTLKWLILIGFGPHTEACVRCRLPVGDIRHPFLSTARGGLVCATCVHHARATFADAQPIDKEVLAALRFLASAPFEALMTDRLNPLLDSLTEVQDLFVHYHIDRELRVPIFLQHLTSI